MQQVMIYFFQGPKTTNELDFEKYGAYYKDIVALLREKSSHFATTIEKQVCCFWKFFVSICC